MKKTFILAGAILLVTLVVSGCSWQRTKTLSPEEAKNKVIEFSEKNMVPPGTKIEAKEIVEEGGLYAIALSIDMNGQKQEVKAYVTKDGKKFFPSAIDMDEKIDEPSDTPPAEVSKSDKPSVELFVMSYCPYGTQIEKGMLPVIEALGDKIDFSLKFVDYAMHGEKELKENLRQYCIQKDEPTKLAKYLTCFLKKGEGTESTCLQSAGISAAKVNGCMALSDKEFKVTENLNDKTTWKGQFPPFDVDKAANDQYGVGGSPTLVINGATAQSGRDAANLLKTICGAFNNPPAECEKELPSDSPAPGFGEGTAANGGAAAANCGS